MASTRTAMAPPTQYPKKGRIQQKKRICREAREPIEGVMQAYTDYIDYLNQPHGTSYDDNVALVEQSVGAKREYFGYGLGTIVCLYLIAGSCAQLICNLIGFGYPAYASVKALRTEHKEDDTQWLTYWTVFAFFSLVDFFFMNIVGWLSIYWLAKAIFLMYLYLPQTMGAQSLYVRVVDPMVDIFDMYLESREA